MRDASSQADRKKCGGAVRAYYNETPVMVERRPMRPGAEVGYITGTSLKIDGGFAA